MENNEEDNNFEYILNLEKLETEDENRLIIAGMASSGDLDHDGERVDMNSLRSQFLKYMENPIIRFMHGKDQLNTSAIGKVIPEYTDSTGKVYKTEFRENGPFIVAELSQADDVASIRKRVNEGILKGLSIGGRAKRVKTFDPTLQKDVNNVIVSRWNETSIVDLPANQVGFFSVLKAACTGPDCPINDGTEPIEKIEPIEKMEPVESDPIVDQAVAKFEEIINENDDMHRTLSRLESEIQELKVPMTPNTIEKGEENENNYISTIEKAEVVENNGGTKMEQTEDGIVRMEVDELTKYIRDTVTDMTVEQETVEKLEDYDRLVKEIKDMRAKIENLEAQAKANVKAMPEGKQMAMKSEGEVEDAEVVEKAAKKKKDKKDAEYDEDGNEIVETADMDVIKKMETEIAELKSSPLYKAQQEEVKVEKTETDQPSGILAGVIAAHYGGN